MENMISSGRVLVRDAPQNSAASRISQQMDCSKLLSYEELVDLIAVECDGMSGASLAGVTRAAASRALERAVTNFAGHVSDVIDEGDSAQHSINDCLVTQEDFEKAIDDVFESAKAGDYEEEKTDNIISSLQEEDEIAKPGEDMENEPSASDASDTADSAFHVNDGDFLPEMDGEDTAIKSANVGKALTELNGGYVEVSEHESVTEYFRAGVDIPDWGERKSLNKSGSLRDLLPKRQTMWLKLDKYGRRVEDTDVSKR